ncbi:MBL fold metallo-hydrolase [Pantoea dispersa]|uniref:MBL fold metallo-hydrolase n=1 Tax=Pantoea dispersa TaxID=59814 RepID=UPI002DBE5CA9|nr:MBL fold metallo-hydrolase [Pantoea dispersa]MEB5838488.1 MBL fold metallo-hydrolase [Pantoea dispersa]
MNPISRRTLLAGSASIAAISSLAGIPAFAAEKKDSKTDKPEHTPNAGVYHHKLGSADIYSITDGSNSFPRRDNFVLNVSSQTVASELENNFLDPDTITLTFTPVLLKTQGQTVIIDTGLGENAFRQSNGIGGQFHRNLSSAGFATNQIDKVLITHFHADHIGGLITADNKSAFPDSQIYVPAEEYSFWMSDSNMKNAATDGIKANFERARHVFGIIGSQVHQFDAEEEVAPGVRSIATPGHTPGHSSFVINSDNQTAIVQGDVTTHPALFIRHPDWHGWSDMDPELAEKTRRLLYDRLVKEKILLQAFHFSFPAMGHVIKPDNGYQFVPLMWDPS